MQEIDNRKSRLVNHGEIIGKLMMEWTEEFRMMDDFTESCKIPAKQIVKCFN